MFCKIYVNVFDISLLIYTLYSNILLKLAYQHPDMKIRQCFESLWCMSMNPNEELPAGYVVASYLYAFLKLLNLNIQVRLILMLIYASNVCSYAVAH